MKLQPVRPQPAANLVELAAKRRKARGRIQRLARSGRTDDMPRAEQPRLVRHAGEVGAQRGQADVHAGAFQPGRGHSPRRPRGVEVAETRGLHPGKTHGRDLRDRACKVRLHGFAQRPELERNRHRHHDRTAASAARAAPGSVISMRPPAANSRASPSVSSTVTGTPAGVSA